MPARSQGAPQINLSALPPMLALHGIDKSGIVPFQIIFKGFFQARMVYIPGVTVTEFRHLRAKPEAEFRGTFCFKVSDQRIVTHRHAQTEQPTLPEVEMIDTQCGAIGIQVRWTVDGIVAIKVVVAIK